MWVSRKELAALKLSVASLQRRVSELEDSTGLITVSEGKVHPWAYPDHPNRASINYVVRAIADHLGMRLKECRSEWIFKNKPK
jgi:hypothetical protein